MMNHKERVDKIMENADEIVSYTKEILENMKSAILTYVKQNCEVIIDTPTENDFFKDLAEIGDRLYKGNFFIERVDEIIFFYAGKMLDKYILDRIFGKNWFTVLQQKAIDFKREKENIIL